MSYLIDTAKAEGENGTDYIIKYKPKEKCRDVKERLRKSMNKRSSPQCYRHINDKNMEESYELLYMEEPIANDYDMDEMMSARVMMILELAIK